MSLDRLQSKPGNFHIEAEPYYTVASSLTTAASNVLPGGYQFGSNFAIAPAGSSSGGGGAHVMKILPNQTYAASSGTGAMISHDGCGVVMASMSNGALHNLQPPTFNGQMLKVVNIATGSASFVTGAVLSGQGTGSTTTAVIPTLTNAVTFGASSGSAAFRDFVGLTTFGGTASNSTYALWSCYQGGGGVGVDYGSARQTAQNLSYVSGQTVSASSGTGAYITYGSAPIVYFQASSGGLLNLQPANYDGQMLTIVNVSTVSASFVTGAVLNGQGTGSTTTVVIPTLTNAFTISTGGVASKVLQAFSSLGSTTSNSTYAVWSCINI
jgi:hypothetical protein